MSKSVVMHRSNFNCRTIGLALLTWALALATQAGSAQGDAGLAAANMDFAFDLFGQIRHEQPHKNIFISPFSVSTVLQMMDNGAAGATRQEMEHVLRTDALPRGVMNAANHGLRQSLSSQTNVDLKMADAIWYEQEIQLKPAFASINREFFGAELAAVDFDSRQSARIINDWAARSTHGKISDIVRWPFEPATRLVLANAIYFKGKWETPFDVKNTEPHAFYLFSGRSKQALTMRRQGRFDYQNGADFQAVRLPYAGKRLCMDVFLPATNSTLEQLLARFGTAAGRDKMLSWFVEREGTVALPRFKIEYNVELDAPLKDLGMKRAFHGGDFSAMSSDPLEISEVKQKNYISVDEQGTEAAAVTVGIMRATAVLRPTEPFVMIVDRPFFFLIEDRQTRTVLFMGAIYNPEN